jgi:hypothetical protein
MKDLYKDMYEDWEGMMEGVAHQVRTINHRRKPCSYQVFEISLTDMLMI